MYINKILVILYHEDIGNIFNKKGRYIISALALGAGAAILGTGFNIYNGIKQESKANSIEKNLKQPQYQIPPEFLENKRIAQQMAQLGLPSAQRNNELNQINSNQAAGLATASRSANPGGAVSNIVGQSNAATNNLNAEDAQARQSNERYYLQENAQLGGQKIAQQQANVFDPYTQHYNEAQAYRGAGMQNINSGIQDITKLGGLAIQYGLMPRTTTPQPTAGLPFDQRILNPDLPIQNGMTGYQLPPLQTQLQ